MSKPDPDQKRVLDALPNGPIKVVAGPGTGKTFTLQKCFSALLDRPASDFGIADLLALTFTNRAAENLKERIYAEVEGGSARGRGAEEPWIHTFHAFCHRLLDENRHRLGLASEIRVLDELERKRFLDRVLRRFRDRGYPERFTTRHNPIDDFQGFPVRARVFLHRLQDDLVAPERFREVALEKLRGEHARPPGERERTEELIQVLYVLYANYLRELEAAGLFDFGTLQARAVALLEGDAEVAERYRRKFRFILVDEFQDTNLAQMRLLRAFSPDFANVLVVGDRKQAIYEWRSARIENLDEFARESDPRYLSQNYRSFGEILDVCHHFITRSDEFRDEPPLVPRRKGRAGEPRVVLFEDERLEASFLALESQRWVRSGAYGWRDIAILMRSVKSASRRIEAALRQYRVPYRTVGGVGFFDRREVGDILAYLRLVVDPYDEGALVRILQNPPVALGDARLHRLVHDAQARGLPLFDVLGDLPETASIREILVGLMGKRARLSTSEMIFHLLDDTGYRKYVMSGLDDEARMLANIKKLYEHARNFEDQDPTEGIEAFIRHLTFAVETDHEEAEELLEEGEDVVRIMTVHQAKGLQFPVVFVPNLRAPSFPLNAHAPDFAFDEAHGFGERSDTHFDALFGERSKERSRREERRILYVAMTRAEDWLILSRPGKGRSPDFFDEILAFEEGRGRSWRKVDFEETEWPEPGATVRQVVAGSAEEIAEAEERYAAIRGALRAPEPVAPDTRRVGGLDLSWSALDAWRRCPLRFRFGYLLRLPSIFDEDGRGASPAARLGTLVHETIRMWNEEGRTRDLVALLEERGSAEAPDDADAILAEARPMLEAYRRSAPPPGEIFEAEFTVELDAPGGTVRLRAVLDAHRIEGPHAFVTDFKTGRDSDPAPYASQMDLYALALFASRGSDLDAVETTLWFLREDARHVRTIRREDLASIRAAILETATRIEGDRRTGRFPPPPDRDCRACPFGGPAGPCPENLAAAVAADEEGVATFPAAPRAYFRRFFDLVLLEEEAIRREAEVMRQRPVEERIERGAAIHPVHLGSRGVRTTESGEFVVELEACNTSRLREGDFVRLARRDDPEGASAVGQVRLTAPGRLEVVTRTRAPFETFDLLDEEISPTTLEETKNALAQFLAGEHPDLVARVLGRRAPGFDERHPSVGPDEGDAYQREAIRKALAARDYALVHGPAGSGKTTTIARLVRRLVREGRRVLLSAYTNRAVDNLLEAVLDHVEGASPVRIGRPAVVSERLRSFALDETRSRRAKRETLEGSRIVGLTAASAGRTLLRDLPRFDVAIVDEAGQIAEPLALAPLLLAERFVLVGDHLQLPTVVVSEEARRGGLGRSLFERLIETTPEASVLLALQYRMNEPIGAFPSAEFYGGRLRAATREVAERRIRATNDSWRSSPLSAALDPDCPIAFLDTPGSGASPANEEECRAAVAVARGLVDLGLAPEDIGMIAPHRTSVMAIRRALDLPLQVDTVDRFQGVGREAIVLLLGMGTGELAPLMLDSRRLNVALTRAKSKLVILGDRRGRDARFRRLLDHVARHGRTLLAPDDSNH